MTAGGRADRATPRTDRGSPLDRATRSDRATRPDRRDRGSASVLVLGLLAVVAVLAGALGALAGAQAARWRAQTAADLGAIAGAQAARRAVEDACAVAGLVVGRNGADLATCGVRAGGVVEVRATVPFGPGEASATARAGPQAARVRTAADP